MLDKEFHHITTVVLGCIGAFVGIGSNTDYPSYPLSRMAATISCLRICWIIALLIPLALVLVNTLLERTFDSIITTSVASSHDPNEEQQRFGSGKMFDHIAEYYDMGNR